MPERRVHRIEREITETANPRLRDGGFSWTMCGAIKNRTTSDDHLVTCRLCRRRMEERYASERDGVDYAALRYQEARDRAADRAAAARIVVERHHDEYETELALLVLARFGREAAA